MKPIMNIFGEKPLKYWMKIYINLIVPHNKLNTIIHLNRDIDKREFNLRVRKTNRGYVLAEGLWESKKTLDDYLSYLNQYSTKEVPTKIHIWNDRPFGNCDFIVDMITLKRRFKRIKIETIMIRDDNNDWWSITNQLD